MASRFGMVLARRCVAARPALAGARALRLAPQQRFLRATCERELEEEKTVRADMEVVSCPAGWSVTHESGKGYFRMSKSAGGAEVMIDCEFEGHQGGSEDEDSQERTSFTVYVTRNGVTADFTVNYVPGSGLSLEGVATYADKAVATTLSADADYGREQCYQGPDVSELESTGVPEKIMEFLDSVGVGEETGAFVHAHCQVLEQDAYIRLLGDLSKLAA
eukprot:TRINITY_DN2439_c0_g2_i2.p2 TRINITY_DN2439_c0_g2~~TRINITY_DN2439_c0_g2_i2.p2  ORF type:complete len:239 (+),score=98.78 TRINITY_DN2439_c0_g2_i2:62-718(+)